MRCSVLLQLKNRLNLGAAHWCAFPSFSQTQHWDHLNEDEKSHIVITALRACGIIRDIQTGQKIHNDVETLNTASKSIYISTTLVSMYAKCEGLNHARIVFDKMPYHNVVSWNALLTGLVQNKQADLALELYTRMVTQGCMPTTETLTAAAVACAASASKEQGRQVDGKLVKVKCLEKGMELHSQALKLGFHTDLFLASTLVDMYAKCGSMQDASMVFSEIEHPDIVLWTALILGYSENNEHECALELFLRLECVPDEQAFLAALMACAGLAMKEEGRYTHTHLYVCLDYRFVGGKVLKMDSLEKGMIIHSRAAPYGYDTNIYVSSTLIDMYAKCGSLRDALNMLSRVALLNVVLLNALILGCVENGEEGMALEFFDIMGFMGIKPDDRTFVAVFMACTACADREEGRYIDSKLVKLDALEKGMALHKQAAIRGYESDVYMVSSLVDMYATCGSLVDARAVFDRAIVNPVINLDMTMDVVLWNSLMTGYAEREPELALQMFHHLPDSSKNARSYLAALVACGNLGCIETGRDIHMDIVRKKLLNDVFIANSLVAFYGKCGCMSDARKVFDNIETKTLPAWNALLTGYSRERDTDQVFLLYHKMQGESGTRPDGITHLSILTACNYAGLVDKGKQYFETWKETGIKLEPEHYHCMVDMLGRANRIDEALYTVKNMPYIPNMVTWNTVLGACKKWNNVEVAKIAFEALERIGAEQSSSYVLMSNIYKSN